LKVAIAGALKNRSGAGGINLDLHYRERKRERERERGGGGEARAKNSSFVRRGSQFRLRIKLRNVSILR
jgi:hypothetical protein